VNMSTNNPVLPRLAAGDQQPSVRDVARLMRDHIWEVLGIAALVTALAVAYTFLATPIYSSDVLVRVDAPEPNAFGVAPQGQVITQPSAPPTEAEIAIMQSRSVIEPVIHQYRFDVVATSRKVPLLGTIAEKFATPGQPARPWFGLDSFAWGGEQLEISSISVPPRLEDEKLELKVLDHGQYELLDTTGQQLLSGTAGQPASGAGISLLVSRLVARPGTRFTVIESNAVNTVHRFQYGLKVVDDGKGTGVVRITFSNSNATVARDVANGIAQSYIAAAIASHQATDGKTLDFIQQELPRLRTDLERAEAELSAYQNSSGSMRPSTEAQAYLQGSIDYQRQIATLQLQRTQLLQNFKPESPEVRNVDQQLAQLNATKQTLDARFSSMPTSERKNADLTRNAKVAESIYTSMVSKAEELSVRRAGTTGNAHIVDHALRPSRPIAPNRPLVIASGVGLGLIAGMLVVFVRRHVLGGVTNPMFIEHYLSVPLFGALGYSSQQAQLEARTIPERPMPGRQLELKLPDDLPQPSIGRHIGLAKAITIPLSLPASAHRLLARSSPQDASIEALRGVRTALRFEMAHAPSKIVALTGPTVATGKSFVAANLSVLLAEAGSRVLLIDADMRCGRLAWFFGQTSAGGLVDVLRGDLQLRSAIRSVGIERLSFMSCGAYPSNPSELLMRPGFNQLLSGLEPRFDMVIVDTPPFLAVTDAAIVANQAGATVLVLRSGMQTKQELEDTVRGLDRSGARLVGAIFNGMPAQRGTARNYGYVKRSRPEPRAKPAKAA
jgi:tyrosine-protein kinase Etk/Wzc